MNGVYNMTSPTDFDSFAFGFDLNSSNLTGSDFSNLVAGQESWTINGATPSFETRQTMEGMLFTNDITQLIKGQMRVMQEGTIMLTLEPDTAGNFFAFGGDFTVNNTFGIHVNAYRTQAFTPTGSSGFTATVNNSRPNVYTISFCNQNGTSYAQINDGTVISATESVSGGARINYPNGMIGGMRTTYFNGRIGRVLVFDRALHFRNNANLQSLIIDEMAMVGL